MALIVKSTRERVVKLFIGVILCLGLAIWCWYDARYKYTTEEQAGSRRFNQYAAPVLVIFGALALFFAIKALRLRIEADEQTGLSINGQSPIAWNAIEDIDTSVLAKKGYLYVKYRDRQGQPAILKLDEFNLDYFDELYAMIRVKLGLPELAGSQTKSSSASAPGTPASDEKINPSA